VPLRKKIKDSLTRQGMWTKRGLHRKGLAEREEKERVLSSERAHKQAHGNERMGMKPETCHAALCLLAHIQMQIPRYRKAVHQQSPT